MHVTTLQNLALCCKKGLVTTKQRNGWQCYGIIVLGIYVAHLFNILLYLAYAYMLQNIQFCIYNYYVTLSSEKWLPKMLHSIAALS